MYVLVLMVIVQFAFSETNKPCLSLLDKPILIFLSAESELKSLSNQSRFEETFCDYCSYLTITSPTWHPRFNVVLPEGGRSQLLSGHVQNSKEKIKEELYLKHKTLI